MLRSPRVWRLAYDVPSGALLQDIPPMWDELAAPGPGMIV